MTFDFPIKIAIIFVSVSSYWVWAVQLEGKKISSIERQDFRLNSKEKQVVRIKQNAETFIRKVFVHDYLRFWFQNRTNGKRLVVRFDRDHPGLGDRLGTILNSFLIAVLSQRVLLIDWIHPQDLSIFFNIIYPELLYDHQKDFSKNVYHCRSQWRPFDLRPFLGNMSTIFIYGTPTVHPLVLRQMVFEFRSDPFIGSIFESLLLLHRDFHIYDVIYRSILTPRADVLRMVDSQLTGPGHQYLAIHARIGKGVGETGGDRFFIQKKASLVELCECFFNKSIAVLNENPNLKSIYVATDTPEFGQIFELRLKLAMPHINLISKHVRLGEPKHTKLCRFKEDRQCMQVVLDFVFLSKCNYLIASHSSFSKVAHVVGNMAEKYIISYPQCMMRAA